MLDNSRTICSVYFSTIKTNANGYRNSSSLNGSVPKWNIDLRRVQLQAIFSISESLYEQGGRHDLAASMADLSPDIMLAQLSVAGSTGLVSGHQRNGGKALGSEKQNLRKTFLKNL